MECVLFVSSRSPLPRENVVPLLLIVMVHYDYRIQVSTYIFCVGTKLEKSAIRISYVVFSCYFVEYFGERDVYNSHS